MRAEHLIVVGEKQTPVLQVRQEAWSFTSWPVFSFFEKKHLYFLFFQNVLSIWQNLQSIMCKPHIWLPAWLGHEKRERKWSRPLEYMNSSTVRILRHKIETTRSRRAGCQTSWRLGWQSACLTRLHLKTMLGRVVRSLVIEWYECCLWYTSTQWEAFMVWSLTSSHPCAIQQVCVYMPTKDIWSKTHIDHDMNIFETVSLQQHVVNCYKSLCSAAIGLPV